MNTYDDVTDYEICEVHKNTKIQISQERNIFSSNEKIPQLHIKGYFIAKNSFVGMYISGIIDQYFIMEFFQKIREKIRIN